MSSIRYVGLLSTLLTLPSVSATEVTRGQQTIYPQNPHLVTGAGEVGTPESREKSTDCIKKAIRYIRAFSWVCGAASLGCLAVVICAGSIKLKVISGILSPLLAIAALFFNKVSTVQAAMVQSWELVKTNVSAENPPAPVKLIDVADGIYIFSGAYCPPCKLLHKSLTQIRAVIPGVEFFEYATDGNNSETQALLQRMGITILGIPLTVVVKNGVIASIINGYSGVEDYVQKLTEALK